MDAKAHEFLSVSPNLLVGLWILGHKNSGLILGQADGHRDASRFHSEEALAGDLSSTCGKAMAIARISASVIT
jgi:hypothetical protein